MKKIVFILTAIVMTLCLAFSFAACGNGTSPSKVAVTNVSLNQTAITLTVGETATLTATVNPSDATDKTVAWKSDNAGIASVSNGTVTAVAPGETKITATADGKKAECTVTVNAAVTSLTEAEWQAAWEEFNESENFSMTSTSIGTATEMVMEGKYDNGKLYQNFGLSETYVVKDGSSYFMYTKEGEEWQKNSILEEIYTRYTSSMLTTVSTMSEAFAAAYDSFAFENGKYTAESVSVGAMTASDVEITLSGSSISEIVCKVSGDDANSSLNIYDIGSTEIELPKVKEPSPGFVYKLARDGQSAYVYGFTTNDYAGSVDLMIAAEYQNKPVTTINANVFGGYYRADMIESLIIPESVTTIEGSAFTHCTGLETIIIPDSVETIGSNAFEDTKWFNDQPDGLVYAGKVAYKYKGTTGSYVEIEDGTKSISPLAFRGCGLTAVSIPGSVSIIGGMAFYECLYLADVQIAEGVERIEAQAFRDCKFQNLTLNLPSTLNYLGSWAFAGSSLRNISFNGTQDQWDNQVEKDSNWNKDEGGTMNINVTYTGN